MLMKSENNKTRKKSPKGPRFYSLVIFLTFLAGLGPIIFNLVIDPYEMNDLVDFGIAKEKISEKAHYPLWKVTHFPENNADIVILGDSRARAMKNKYWHDLGAGQTYNFAYGGATMLEIYDTFHVVKNSRNLRTLVVGIQLRSFDPDHKGRMNRVSEAVRLTDNPIKYYSNWFVSGIGVRVLDNAYGDKLNWMAAANPIPSVYAGEIPGELEDLLKPVVCASCLLPENVPAQQHPSASQIEAYYFATRLGVWQGLWPPITVNRTLPQKYAKQIVTNARSDWRSFEFSESFWSYLVEISNWCKSHQIKLVFIIPPTIVEMQNRLVEFGHGALNHHFRERLAQLGLVVDFDFDNHVTRDLARFKDAYHFDAKTSKLIVGEILQLVSTDETVIAQARMRREDIICPLNLEEISLRIFNEYTEVTEGKSCRIWRGHND
ncbi:MAG: hypothetical protein JKY91_00135 [Emcibacter sp.]|nr:hypothetical protein [Emcibacter sp.]